MIQVKRISIQRVEGPTDECVSMTTADGATEKALWLAADEALRMWARTAPKNGGYDKCDFQVEYMDGSTYKGRYDLKHIDLEYPNLSKHIEHHVKFHSGKYCPSWMTSEQYAKVISSFGEECRASYEQFLNTYQISPA